MKKLLLIILIAIISAVGCVLYFDRNINPELCFFHKCAKATDSWEKDLRTTHESCIVMAGGSEIRSSVDPALALKELDVPLINTAGTAGFGLSANTSMALRYLRPHDTLMVSMNGLSNPEATTGGIKLATIRDGYSTFSTGIIPANINNLLTPLCGDTKHIFLYLTKKIRVGINRASCY